MAKVAAPKVEAGSNDFTPKQAIRLTNGLYGGMFAWYSLPKMYQKFDGSGQEEKFYVGFVITHDKANKQLKHFSEAMIGIRPKLFYSPDNGMKSSYVALLYALMGGKKSCEQIADMDTDDLPDLDEMIGRPVILYIEKSTKADKNGIYSNKIKGLEPADKDLIAAIKPLYNTKKAEKGDKGTVYLLEPKAVYEDEIDPSEVQQASEQSDDFGADLDDEIPF